MSSSRWGEGQLEEGLAKTLEEETQGGGGEIATPQEMLVGNVPERDRSAEGRAEHETLEHIH